ncbi:YopX family protein [Lysinibacillus fusiformis]|uniref:Phage uncharacterized protein TIGR01671 n=1 Tax=Lysinibacillus fusiformis TaxID=28031 RepID=A0A1H9GPU4_9BACI|nr:YopX family protein [Lysinibacillus fusiformis]SCY14099.1 phage uncharacterized protein TIGR01671 [Lysinibacillus fusiformis]SEN32189.1 phage uncharacterized protein TIGR01671 [Lysinibacillus fusiformis]SEQ52060.1 phage uncharacterized protein TIGR01671 [Lysinibacillus fusiformis]
MREIKFRAWDKKRKELFRVHDLNFNRHDGTPTTIMGYTPDSGNCWNVFGGHFMKYANEQRYVLMQFTGVTDKNGREIYEGDLYKYTNSHDLYNPESGHTTLEVDHVKAVIFENGAFYHGRHLLSEVIEYDDSFTYVGNIYENPELLGDSQ